jgi:hypothetical protein
VLASGLCFAQAPEASPPPSADPSLPPLVSSPEQAEPSAPEGESIPSVYRPASPGHNTANRILLETLAGGGTGFAAGIAGLFTGLALVGTDCSELDCAVPVLGSMALGVVFGTPLGVYGVGRAMDGRGTYLASLTGTALGTVAGVALAAAAGHLGNDLLTLMSLIVGPIAGAVLGYEFSHSSASDLLPPTPGVALSGPGLQCIPVFSVTPAGGVLGGFAGRF